MIIIRDLTAQQRAILNWYLMDIAEREKWSMRPNIVGGWIIRTNLTSESGKSVLLADTNLPLTESLLYSLRKECPADYQNLTSILAAYAAPAPPTLAPRERPVAP